MPFNYIEIRKLKPQIKVKFHLNEEKAVAAVQRLFNKVAQLPRSLVLRLGLHIKLC